MDSNLSWLLCTFTEFFFFSCALIFFDGSAGKESDCNAWDPGSILGSGISSGEENVLPTPVFLPGEFHGQWSLVGYSPWGSQNSMLEWLTHTYIWQKPPWVLAGNIADVAYPQKTCSFGISLVAQLAKNLPAMQETPVWFLGQEDPLEKDRLPTPVFWPGKFHGL